MTTFAEKIDAIFNLQNDFGNNVQREMKSSTNKALQELREEIQTMYNNVEVEHKIHIAQAVYARALLDVLRLIGESKQ